VQVIASEENSEGGQFCKAWADLMRRNINLVKQEGTEITFFFPRGGLTGLPAFFHTYLHRLNDSETFHTVFRVTKQGFDTIIVTCFYDPMLRELRQAVSIPVLSIGESSMLLAAMMGAKFGVVSISPEAAYDVEENIVKYGLRERAVRVRFIPETAEEKLYRDYVGGYGLGSGCMQAEQGSRRVAWNTVAAIIPMS
jgi:Asp/Glu/hydantoin racemase